jgi:uncharacterized membrane protein (UPF0182 family)
MPKSLLSHIQVPQRQFEIQAEKLLQYHVKNVKSFYDGDDAWSLPLEIYGSATAKLKPYQALGVDEFIYYASLGLGLKEQKRSLELFIKEVIPAFA